MEKLKDLWKNQSEDQRRKIIAYSIVGFLGIGMFYGVYLIKGKDKNQKVEALSNPYAKAGKNYNSRLEANQMDKKDTVNINMAIDEIFGTSKPEPKVEEKNIVSTETYYEPDYSHPVATQSNSQNYGGGRSSYSQPVNHYSDFKNNDSEFYEEKTSSRIQQIKKKASNTKKSNYKSSLQELDENIATEQYQEKVVKPEIKTGQIKARLLSQGYVNTGKSISFVLLEKAELQAQTIKKGQIITGVAQEQNNRLLVKFSTIKVNGKIIPVDMQLYGSDGMEGLPISATEQNQNNRTSSIVSNTLGNIPVVGGIANDAIQNNSNNRKSNIKLTPNISCTILYKI